MPVHNVHWRKGREKVPTACKRCLNPLTNLGSSLKSQCCRAQKQTTLYGNAGSNTQFPHCTFYFLTFLEGTIELARFSKQSKKLWQGVNRNRASFHEIISSSFYTYTCISLLGTKGRNSFILFAHWVYTRPLSLGTQKSTRCQLTEHKKHENAFFYLPLSLIYVGAKYKLFCFARIHKHHLLLKNIFNITLFHTQSLLASSFY